MSELKHWHSLFIAELLRNGHNATQAYLTVRPDVTHDTARAEGSTTLALPTVKSALDKEVRKQDALSLATRETLITEAEEIRNEALKTKKLGNALQAVELKGKVAGVFAHARDDTEGYTRLMQRITIKASTVNIADKQVNVSAQDSPGRTGRGEAVGEVVDVEESE